MNKTLVCLLILGFVAVAAFAEETGFRGHHHHHFHQHEDGHKSDRLQQFRKEMKQRHEEKRRDMMKRHWLKKSDDMDEDVPSVFVSETLHPGKTYLETIKSAGPIPCGGAFSVPYTTGDSIAVHIVHASDLYDQKTELKRCNMADRKCVKENGTESLSFEVSAEELGYLPESPYKFKEYYAFTVFSAGMNRTSTTGAVVGFYVCVGKNVTLQTCSTKCTKKCGAHGTRSDVMDVCVCDEGYTGRRCQTKTEPAPDWIGSSFFDEFSEVFEIISCIFSFIFSVIFFVVIFMILLCCCGCLRACCIHCREKRGRVCRRSVPPPPAYNYNYQPLNVPPPPPPPMEGQVYSVPDCKAIEMSTLPAARTANPVYIMPPLAPVKQVPVFIQPPAAPKN